MDADTLTKAGRFGAVAAAPLGAASLTMMVAGEATGASMSSSLAIAAGVAGLAATVALLLGLVWLHHATSDRMAGRGAGAMVVALVGAALTVGAVWSMVFVAPSLDARHPGLINEPLLGVVAGYIGSHAVLGVGVLAWAVAARRTGAVPRAATTLLIVGGVVCVTPLPARYLVVAVGLLVAARAASGAGAADASDRVAEPV